MLGSAAILLNRLLGGHNSRENQLSVIDTMSSKEDIKSQLINYKPSAEENLVIRSAMFNFITLGTLIESLLE
jgi:hypothetical protein